MTAQAGTESGAIDLHEGDTAPSAPSVGSFAALMYKRSGNWYTRDAHWASDTSGRYVRCLVGPGAAELDDDLYVVWLRIFDFTEVPVRRAGHLVLV